MLLKTAYFRLKGAKLTDEIGTMLGAAKTAAKADIPFIDFEHYHSLRFWAMLLQAQRNIQGIGFPLLLDFEFHTERLHNHRYVEMRYRSDLSTPAEALDVSTDVSWLRNHHQEFWLP